MSSADLKAKAAFARETKAAMGDPTDTLISPGPPAPCLFSLHFMLLSADCIRCYYLEHRKNCFLKDLTAKDASVTPMEPGLQKPEWQQVE